MRVLEYGCAPVCVRRYGVCLCAGRESLLECFDAKIVYVYVRWARKEETTKCHQLVFVTSMKFKALICYAASRIGLAS